MNSYYFSKMRKYGISQVMGPMNKDQLFMTGKTNQGLKWTGLLPLFESFYTLSKSE